MSASFWSSLALGVLLGAANALASVAVGRWAEGRAMRQFVNVVLGGMVLRMVVVLALAALALAFLPLHRGAFVAGLFVAFMGGLALDVFRLRRVPSAARG